MRLRRFRRLHPAFRFGHDRSLLVFDRHPAPGFTSSRQGFMKGDPGHPGRKTSSTFKLVQVFVGTNPSLLENIFGFDIVDDDGANHPIQALIVPAHQQFIKRGFASAHEIDQFGIRNRLPLLQEHI